MKLARGVIIAALLTAAACGSDSSDADTTSDGTVDATGVASDGTQFASLSELLDSPEAESGTVVVVSAIFFDDGSGARMCEALAESFPPQCIGRSLEVDPELLEVEWTEQDGIRWTDRPVSVLGWIEGTTFVVT